MYCGQCGALLANDDAAFCGACGARRAAPSEAARYVASSGDPPAPEQDADAALPPFAGGRIDWTLRDVLFGSLWFLAFFLVIPIPFVAPFLAFGDDSPQYMSAALFAGAASEVALIGIAVWFTFRKYGGSWARLGFRTPTWSTVGYAAAAVAAAFALAAVYGVLIEIFDIDALRSQRDDQLPREVLDSGALLAIAGVVVIGFAPVCEEIFFRGFILPGMVKAWGVTIGIALSGLVFSTAHIGPAWHKTLIPIFIIGAVFGAAYYRSGNIFTTILAHALFNAISFAALAAGDADEQAALGAARELLAGAMGR